MSLIITPRHFQQRAEFYQQLGQCLAAGLPLLSALEIQERTPPHPSFRQPVRRIRESIQDGAGLNEAIRQTGAWLPAFDIALLHAGEQSGTLPDGMRRLAAHYAERARLARQMIGSLIYPLLVLHLAAFIFPFKDAFLSGNWLAYLAKTVGGLGFLYATVLLLLYLLQGHHAEGWRELVERVLHRIPVLGTARRYQALSRLAWCLEALLSAGVTVIEAWDIAAAASGSMVLRKAISRWQPQVRAGQTPGEAVSQSPEFPQMFANLYSTGEVSGQLDESLRNLGRYYQEESGRKFQVVAVAVPMIIYGGVMVLVAAWVIKSWLAYFQQINDAINAVP